jgi:hypothetical protein
MEKGRKEVTRAEWIADAISTMKKRIEEQKQIKQQNNDNTKRNPSTPKGNSTEGTGHSNI